MGATPRRVVSAIVLESLCLVGAGAAVGRIAGSSKPFLGDEGDRGICVVVVAGVIGSPALSGIVNQLIHIGLNAAVEGRLELAAKAT